MISFWPDPKIYQMIEWKALTQWCSNNWRMALPMSRKSNNFHVRLQEILWKTRKEKVEEEIARLLGVEVKDVADDPRCFTTRSTAIKNIMDKLTQEERAELEREKVRIENQGYSEEHKRR
jgi:hypothetical protein